MASTRTRKRRSRSVYGLDLGDSHRSKQRHRKRDVTAWDRLVQLSAIAFVLHLFRRIGLAINAILHSRWLLLLPFGTLLTIESIDFLVLRLIEEGAEGNLLQYRFGFGGLEDDRDTTGSVRLDNKRYEAEQLKMRVRLCVYAFTAFLAMVHRREVYHYFKKWPHLILLTCYLLLTAVYSINPVAVFANTSVILIGYLSAIVFATAHAVERRYVVCYATVFVPILIVNVSGFLLFMWQDIGIIDFIQSSRRYGGLAGNPNSQGALAALGYWAAACLVLARSVRPWVRVVAAIGAMLFVLNVIMAGSGTSITTIVLVSIVLFWLRFLALFKTRIQRALNIAAMMSLILALILIVVSSSLGDLFLAFTASLGKDTTLTGRTQIWAIAREAIAVHPVFGWGYDSHASVIASGAYRVDYDYYHNGFLDTMVSGGIVLLLIVIYNLVRFARVFFLNFKGDPDVFPMVVPLIMLLVFNLTEYSLLRPHSPIWLVYVLAFVMLTFHQRDRWFSRFLNVKQANGNDAGKHRSRKRQLRWA